MRAETGHIKFGDDWRGVFIRADDAIALAAKLRRLIGPPDHRVRPSPDTLAGLLTLLDGVQTASERRRVQRCRTFSLCRLRTEYGAEHWPQHRPDPCVDTGPLFELV